MALLTSVIVPLVTPFTDDTSALSEIRFARLVAFHRELGAGGFIVGTEAGEVFSLSLSERKQILEWAIRESHGLTLFVNVTAMTTSATIDLAQHAERHGAKGAVFAVPPHAVLDDQEIQGYVTAVRRHANLPCAFLGPKVVAEDSLALFDVKTLEQVGMGSLAFFRSHVAEEFATANEMVSPLGIFGADWARKISAAWPQHEEPVRQLLQLARTHRVGKALLQMRSLDVGPPRGPVQELHGKQLETLEKVVTSLI